MTDQTDKPKLGTRPPLGLKRTVETGKVKQSFSHGRSNTVVVEVKKRRILGRPGDTPAEAPKTPVPAAEAPKPAAPAAKPAPTAPKRSAADEITTRRELQEKLLREADEARMAALEEARRRDDRVKVEQTEDEKRRAGDNRRTEEEAVEAARLQEAEPQIEPVPEPSPVVEERIPVIEDEDERGFRRPGAPAPKRTEPARAPRNREDRRHSGKLTVTRALSGEDDSRARS